ncbi:CHAT domain-containing protein [Nonomuraea thailandensis]
MLIPTMGLSAVPWGLLPGLRGRPLTVAPSALVWLAARRATEPFVRDGSSSVLVAGPDLEHAEREIERLGAVHPKARTLRGERATVSATLSALDGASFAHFAAHGHHERENVLFSRLDLADGPLMAHDLQRLDRTPGHVVLSACDVGQAVVRAGDELLGFTAALLHLGTSTVISSLTRVPDAVAERVMTAYHRGVALGASPPTRSRRPRRGSPRARSSASARADQPVELGRAADGAAARAGHGPGQPGSRRRCSSSTTCLASDCSDTSTASAVDSARSLRLA